MSERPVSLGMSRMTGKREEPEVQPIPDKAVEAQPLRPVAEVHLGPEQVEEVRARIIDALHTCYDPELPVNIYELGLVYDVYVQPDGEVNIRMTLTSPACPVAGSLPGEVERKVRTVPNVTSVKVDLVWDPPWTPRRMSEAARLQLGMDDW